MAMSTAQWRKSSHSDANGGHCVELASWRKASASDANGGDCVELASRQNLVAVRDSKDPDGAVLSFGVGAFRSFVAEIKQG